MNYSNTLPLVTNLLSLSSTKDNPKALRDVLKVVKKEFKDYTIERFEK